MLCVCVCVSPLPNSQNVPYRGTGVAQQQASAFTGTDKHPTEIFCESLGTRLPAVPGSLIRQVSLHQKGYRWPYILPPIPFPASCLRIMARWQALCCKAIHPLLLKGIKKRLPHFCNVGWDFLFQDPDTPYMMLRPELSLLTAPRHAVCLSVQKRQHVLF